MTKPVMYGRFHILFALFSLILSLLLAMRLSNVSREKRIRSLNIIGFILVGLEIYKQYYLTFKIHHGTYDWFHFPFQLCSMPMYICFALPLLKKYQKPAEAFLMTFGLSGAVFALAYPQDMLSDDMFLLLHSFSYHGVLLFTAFWTAFSEKLDWKDFKSACGLFLLFAVMAEVINTIGHLCGGNPDMFYISPFMSASQPVFHWIGLHFGRMIEIVIYLALLIGENTLVFYIYRLLSKRKSV